MLDLKRLAEIEQKVIHSRWYWSMTYVERVEYCLRELEGKLRDTARLV